MKRRLLAALVLALGAGFLSLDAWRGHESQTATTPLHHGTAGEENVVQGLVSGVVKRADGSPAAGATVLLDTWAWPLGDVDMKMAVASRSAVQNEDGEWEWFEPPAEPPKHEPFSATADDEGRYAFEDGTELQELLSQGRVKVWAELDGQVAPKALIRAESGPAQVPPLTLGPALRPRLRVFTHDGLPIVDAHVEVTLSVEHDDGASRDAQYALLYILGARTDASGLATLPGVPDRSDWSVWIRVNPNDMPRHLEMDASLTRLRSAEPLELRISRGFTLRGRVELPDASPGKGVSISSRREGWDPNPNAGHSTETAENGTFELLGVPTVDAVVEFVQAPWLRPGPPDPGTFMRSAGEGAASRLTMRVEGSEGEIVDLGTVRLLGTLSIRGRVVGPDGKPPRRGHVMLDGPGMSRSLGPDGSFELRSLEPGRHTIKATVFEDGEDAWTRGLEATLSDVEAGATDVLIRVTGGGNLIVRFHPLGKPDEPLEVNEASICWGNCGGGGGDRRKEMRMTFEPGRRSDIRVEAEGYKTKFLGPIVIHADRKTVVDVELEPTD